ncbi:MAG: HNH endonuclease [Eubacteriaceae bacterium]|nr:HNH endonuclease [Eubacteriaceae bacterium]
MSNKFNIDDYWRAIILYGLNTATYKIALAKCLHNFTLKGKDTVSMHELATEFFNAYKVRLTNNMPQLDNPARQTKMEYIINLYNLGKVSEAAAIEYVKNNAFSDVIPRFHTVNNDKLPIEFYEHSQSGLILHDNVFLLFEGQSSEILIQEVESRWDLLEAAFQLKRVDEKLVNDIRKIYLSDGYSRKNITGLIPVLNGYQKGICFYCGESMDGHDIHVDHVIPRQVIYHDEIWNLVLAHGFCNEQKSDALPSEKYIKKLIERNEHFIASNHPIKNQLIKTMGQNVVTRRKFVQKVYEDVKLVIPYTWEGIKGYNPDTDEFYKSFVRSLKKW